MHARRIDHFLVISRVHTPIPGAELVPSVEVLILVESIARAKLLVLVEEDLGAEFVTTPKLIAHAKLVVAAELVIEPELVSRPDGHAAAEGHLASDLILVTQHRSCCKMRAPSDELPVAHAQARAEALVLAEVVVVSDRHACTEHGSLSKHVLVAEGVSCAELAVLAEHVVVTECISRGEAGARGVLFVDSGCGVERDQGRASRGYRMPVKSDPTDTTGVRSRLF